MSANSSPNPGGPATRDLVAWLANPTTYEPRPASVEHRETHISHVFLAGDRVYKLKKPVRFEFLDYSTLERRRVACEAEVRLNRRMAPGVYDGVTPITRRGEGWEFAGEGPIVDYVVVMRRLDLERGLDQLIEHGTLQPAEIERLANQLSEVYCSRPPLSISGAEYRASYERRVQANADDLLGLVGAEDVALRVHQAQLAQLLLHAEQFDARVAEGRIIDGHGDLRPEHIILPRDSAAPLQVFDCVEFNEEFRTIDVVDELCFLAAECERLGAGAVGATVLETYYERSGDHPAPAVVKFYESYRATVRAKVAVLRAAQLPSEGANQAKREGAADLKLADRYAAEFHEPLCVVVSGASGVGKSTLASQLAKRLRLVWLRTDEIRGEMSAPLSERYSNAARNAVYEELFRRAADRLAARTSVVLDGTFLQAAQIEQASQIAGQFGARFRVLRCTCPPEVARERIAARAEEGADPSEADPALHDRQLAGAEILSDDVPFALVDTTVPPAEQFAAALELLRPSP